MMSDAAIERLAKIISGASDDSGGNDGAQARRPFFEYHLGLAEGWFSLVLLAIVIYSTIWSVQFAGWVDHLDILSLTTAVGLILGVFAAKQQRFPRVLVYAVIIGLGLLLAFWQTAGAFYNGDVGSFAQGIGHWFSIVFSGGSINDNAIFLFLIVSLGFVLATMSVWLVYCMHSPWLMIVANGVVLIINLNNLTDGFVLFLVIFLIASLLLLLRLNLYESIARWKRMGLRYADDIGWDVMQAGSFISIGILIFSWLLPNGYINGATAQVWNSNVNPVVQVQNAFNRAFSLNGGNSPSNHGNFRDTLALGGNPNLNDAVVYTLRSDSTDVNEHYLSFVNYETYNNGSWSIGPTDSVSLKANVKFPLSSVDNRTVKQTISLVNPPGEQNAYILGTPEIINMNMAASVQYGSGGVVAWLGKSGPLGAGTSYTVSSTISSADVQTLDQVPMPQDAPRYTASNYDIPTESISDNAYSPSLVNSFTQWPRSVDKLRVAALAQQIVSDAHATSMYQKAVALEDYFRDHYRYSVAIHPKEGEDPVMWFLFDNQAKAGFCNYFASAMALLARALGMPTRVVAGYAPGQYDNKSGQYVVHGKDAHAWTQIDFAGYGWINFEPSASFVDFTRPQNGTSSSLGSSGASNLPSGVIPPGLQNRLKDDSGLNTTGSDSAINSHSQDQLRQGLGIGLGALILLLLFSCLFLTIWWRRLFLQYSLSSQLYGRICVLARWAGIRLEPSQTPYEYLHSVALSALPAEADTTALERLGDIYVRERWAAPESAENPLRSGEINELPGIWQRLRPHLFLYVVRHPHFIFRAPLRGWRILLAARKQRRTHRVSNGIL